MLDSLPRRKKGILITTVLGISFLAVTAGLLFWRNSAREIYLPGQAIEGVTSSLDRTLPEDAPAVSFEDVADEAGLAFTHFPATRTSRLPEDMGSGVAWGDYDNDGWEDLYLVNLAGALTTPAQEIASTGAPNALFRSNGDGTFADASAQAGVDMRCWCSGAAWGDYDNDGNLDLFVTEYGTNRLYRNRGDGVFEDRTDRTGVRAPDGFWAGASWADYNRDGLLDLYVTGYVRFSEGLEGQASRQYDIESPASINPSSFAPERNLLYLNKGDGTFSEVAERAGVSNAEGRSLSATWADFDEDGWPDLYVANDVSDNVLYRNLGDGTFDEISHLALVADYRGAMGLAVGDWDGDLDLDLFVTHWIAQENALYSNRIRDAARPSRNAATGPRPLRFIDVADRYGLGQVALDFVGWGTFFFDYDNDGRQDLFVSNGSTFQMRDLPEKLIPMNNLLFWNGGDDRGFFNVSGVAGASFQTAGVGRGAAYSDYDHDGDLDIVVSIHGGRPLLLKNAGHPANHWLGVRLVGRQSNRDGIGARVRVVYGDQAAIQEVGSQSSYLSQSSRVAHFGLGVHARADTVEVSWPSGKRSVVVGVDVDRMITVDEND